MFNNNLFRNPKPRYNLIEYELCCNVLIVSECRHGFFPLCKVVNDQYDISMLPWRNGVVCYKIYSPLHEGVDSDDEKHWSRMCTHIFSKYLARVTFLYCFNAISKDRWLEISNAQIFLGCFQPWQVTATFSTMAVIQNQIHFLMSQEMIEKWVHLSSIQSVGDNDIIHS